MTGKKHKDHVTEENSIYVNADEHTNAFNPNSQRYNVELAGQLSDGDDGEYEWVDH